MTDKNFTNIDIKEDNIPSGDNLDFEELADSHDKMAFITFFVFWAVVLIGALTALFFTGKLGLISQFYPIPIAYAGLLIAVYIWSGLMAEACGFSLRDKDIHFKSGIIWKKTISLPFNRIQHVELESGPIERAFKLSTLKFFTAGGASTDMKIPALTMERASRLREFVIKKSGISEDAIASSGNE